MKKSKFTSKRLLKYAFYGAAAVLGVLVAVSSVKKKRQRVGKVSKKLLKKTVLAVKSTKDQLTKRQNHILRLFNREDKITSEMVQDVIGKISDRTIRRDLDFLEARGYVKQMGKTRGSYYELK